MRRAGVAVRLASTCLGGLGVGVAASALALPATEGCSSYGAEPPATDATTPDASSSGGDAASGTTGGSGGAAGEGGTDGGTACPNPTTLHLPLEADTALLAEECNGAITRGQSAIVNIGLSRYVARFTITADARTTMQSETLVGGSLGLAADVDCSECGDGGLPSTAGTLTMWVLRSDWDEGDGGSHSGADWCRRTTSDRGWGTASVASGTTAIAPNADYVGPMGSLAILDGALTATIPVDATAASEALVKVKALDSASAVSSLAVFVEMTSGGRFIATTKESQLATKPTLDLLYCPK